MEFRVVTARVGSSKRRKIGCRGDLHPFQPKQSLFPSRRAKDRPKMRQADSGAISRNFVVGQIFSSGRARITAEEIQAFAAEFDPQPFHLDKSAARESFFRGLAASGWHTAAITMRLLVGAT